MLRPPFSKHLIEFNHWDVIVIGAGAAGLMASLELPENLNVLLLNKLKCIGGKSLYHFLFGINEPSGVDNIIFPFLLRQFAAVFKNFSGSETCSITSNEQTMSYFLLFPYQF